MEPKSLQFVSLFCSVLLHKSVLNILYATLILSIALFISAAADAVHSWKKILIWHFPTYHHNLSDSNSCFLSLHTTQKSFKQKQKWASCKSLTLNFQYKECLRPEETFKWHWPIWWSENTALNKCTLTNILLCLLKIYILSTLAAPTLSGHAYTHVKPLLSGYFTLHVSTWS